MDRVNGESEDERALPGQHKTANDEVGVQVSYTSEYPLEKTRAWPSLYQSSGTLRGVSIDEDSPGNRTALER